MIEASDARRLAAARPADRLSAARRFRHRAAVALVWLSVAIVLFPLGDMFVMVAAKAIPALHPDIFTTVTTGVAGGLQNAILGTLLLVGLATVASVALGVLGGVYVREFGGRLAGTVRMAADVMAGVPSIVIGYFGYATMVTWLGWGFSALAGGFALAIIMLPYVLRATDLALGRVPEELRDASLALGAPEMTTLRRVAMRSALPGIVTGVLLAVGIAVGETAPLLYTAAWSNYNPSVALTHSPVGYLTYVVWTFIQEPFSSAHALAYAAAFLLMVFVLLLNVAVRRILVRETGAER